MEPTGEVPETDRVLVPAVGSRQMVCWFAFDQHEEPTCGCFSYRYADPWGFARHATGEFSGGSLRSGRCRPTAEASGRELLKRTIVCTEMVLSGGRRCFQKMSAVVNILTVPGTLQAST